MQKTDGAIIAKQDGMNDEHALMTYSEEERQQHEIDSANASLVFSPAHIQYYPAIKREYSLTHVETLLYGFIAYYMGNGNRRFYFTNEQLAQVIDCSERTIKASIKALSDKGMIQLSYRIKAGGGTIRFVTGCKICPSDGNISARQTVTKLPANKNKIKENKINVNTNVLTLAPASGFGNADINTLSSYFKERMGIPKEDCSQRQSRQYWQLLLRESKTKSEGVKWLIDLAASDKFYRNNITSSKDLYYQRVKLISRKRGNGVKIAVMPDKGVIGNG